MKATDQIRFGHCAVDVSQDADSATLTFPERYLPVFTHYKLTDIMPDLSPVNYISDPNEWLALLSVGGLWRMMFPTDTTRPDEELMSDEVIQDHMNACRRRPLTSCTAPSTPSISASLPLITCWPATPSTSTIRLGAWV
jgi:hypothetical protein